jgi:hypothetical protein
MIMVRFIEMLRRNLRLLVRLSFVLLGLVVVGDVLLVDKEAVHTTAEKIPGFWAFFGFVGCVIIIYCSKIFGGLGIMRREDFYE